MRRVISICLILSIGSLAFSQVMNPDKPEKGQWDLQMKKVWEIEGSGTDVFGTIQEIEITEDGRVYILDAKNFKIFIFNEDGKFISAFGKRGEGPGEIRNLRMGDQLFPVGNRIIVVDRGRIHYFTQEGKFIKTDLYPFQTKPQAFVSENLFISAPATVDDPRKPDAKVKLYNLSDKTEKIIATFTPFNKATISEESRGSQVTIAIVIGDITPLMLVKYRDGKIYQGMTDRYQIQVMDLEGRPVNSFGIDNREPIKISAQYKKELGEQFDDAPEDMIKKIIDGLPEIASYFYNLFIDKSGMVYVFVSDPESRSKQSIDIFSPEGKYLYRSEMKMDEGLIFRNLVLWENSLFIAVEDQEGDLKVAKYSIKLPKKS